MNSAANTNDETATVTKSGKVIRYRHLKERDGRHMGKPYVGVTHLGQHADVIPGVSIRLHGVDATYRKPAVPHDLTFAVGDTAIHGSYNLVYTGKIVKITAKTVTIQEGNDRPKRLSIAEFGRRNAHYDAATIARRNGSFLD